MHYIAPIPIIFGVMGVIAGFLWLVTLASEDGAEINLPFIGRIFFVFRVAKALFNDPMSVLPAFGILLVSAGLIWLGVAML